MADPIFLSDVDANLLPRTISAPVFNRAVEQSAVMQLARRVPLALTGNTAIPVSMDVPLADWVAEGGRKPVSSGSVGIKQMVGKKVAVLVPVSEEVARTNPAGLYDQLQQDLPLAIARAFDYAAIHGKRIIDGSGGPFTDALVDTTKEVVLGTNTQSDGGLWADIVEGEQLVVDDGWDFTGFAADPRLRPALKLAVDANGRPLFVDNLASGGQTTGTGGFLDGYPVHYSRGVAGKLNRQSTTSDQGLRAIGGDWTQAAYGVGMDITIRVSREATYIDADDNVHSAFQENLVLLLAEAYYGFVVGDVDAFAKYTTTPGS
jgi:HK97 family phage major capsid protein